MGTEKYDKWNHMESDLPIDPTIDRKDGPDERLDEKVN